LTLVVETRKIQRLGSSSLVVTLPKNWARKNNLRPGDPIYMVDEGGHLKIVPGTDKKPCVYEEVASKLTRNLREVGIEKAAKCAYLNGYQSLRIEYAVSYQKPDEIISVVKNLPFVSNIREEYNTVVIEFKDNDENDPQKFLRRMFIEYHNLIESIKQAHETGVVPKEAIDEILEDIEKLHNTYRLSINKICSQKTVREGEKMSRHSATSLLGVLPRMMAGLAESAARYKGDKEAWNLIDKLVIAFREAVGSYLSESLKRIHLYQQMRSKLNKLIEKSETAYPDLAVRIEDILLVLDEMTSDTICLALRNEKK
jgi:phosphate uptake regulator